MSDVLIKNLDIPKKGSTLMTLMSDGSVYVCTTEKYFYTEAIVLTEPVGSVQNDLLRNCIDDVIERNNGKEGQAIRDYDGCANVHKENT